MSVSVCSSLQDGSESDLSGSQVTGSKSFLTWPLRAVRCFFVVPHKRHNQDILYYIKLDTLFKLVIMWMAKMVTEISRTVRNCYES